MAYWTSKGPSLAYAGSKFQKAWLEEWLVQPSRIRPAGYQPYRYVVAGTDGDRVDISRIPPHTATSTDKALLIAEYLSTLTREIGPFPIHDAPAAISGQVHFQNVLGCGSCHQVAPNDGARSGPELYTSGNRLTREWISSYVHEPRYWSAGPMPRLRVRSDQLKAITDYVMSLRIEAPTTRAGIATRDSTQKVSANLDPNEPSAIYYRMLCSQCHGITGNGKGINAPYLSEQPRNHRDAEAMRKLSDDHLFQVIKFGGPAVERSTLMPAWGGTLEDDQIRGLVKYLRTLSKTEQAVQTTRAR
jgi:mono/diheme cytochrome c family protein